MEGKEKVEETKSLRKEDAQKKILDVPNEKKGRSIEKKGNSPKGDAKEKKKHKEKKVVKLNELNIPEKKKSMSKEHIINKDELFVGGNNQLERTKENKVDIHLKTNNVMENRNKKLLYNTSIEKLNDNRDPGKIEKTLEHSEEKATDIPKTSKISENAELVVEPLVFEEKLNLWKGTINSIQIKKEDEKKQQEERLRILENVKLAQNLKKEEVLLQREYLEQLKKDEELAKKIEQELQEEVENELLQIAENDMEFAKRLQNSFDENSVISNKKKGGIMKKLICFQGSNKNVQVANENNNDNDNNDNNINDTSTEKSSSKKKQLKEKIQNFFKKEKKHVNN